MIDLKKSPPELFSQVLEGNLRGIGRTRKLFGHFAEAVVVRLRADGVGGVGEAGGLLALRGAPGLWERARPLDFLRGGSRALEGTAILARVSVHGRQLAVVGVARRAGDLGQAARRTLDRLCRVLGGEL